MVTWDDVVVAIPTCPERRSTLSLLLEQLGDACPNTPIVQREHVPGEPARVDFPRALAAASKLGRSWVLQLEDDVALAPTFAEEALKHGLDLCDVLTLFSRNKADLAALDQGEKVRRASPGSFSMSQGFLIRAELAAGVEAFAPGWYAAHPEHNRAADLLLAAYLSSRKASLLVRIPSLVQHRRLPSTLPKHRGARQSESYRAAFGEIGK